VDIYLHFGENISVLVLIVISEPAALISSEI